MAWHQGLAGKLKNACRPPQPWTSAIAIAGCNAGVDQQAQWLYFPTLAEMIV